VDLVWLAIGILLGISAYLYVRLHRRRIVDWKGWGGLLAGESLVLFCVAWSAASLGEGEPRAASMGLIFFGGAGVLTLVLTWRLFLSKAPLRETVHHEEATAPEGISVVSRSKKGLSRRDRDILIAAVVTLFIISWFIGSTREGPGLDPFFHRAFPDTEVIRVVDNLHEAHRFDDSIAGYVTTGTAAGFGGPLTVAVAVSPAGRVTSVAVVEHRETPSFFEKALAGRILERLAGRTYQESIVLGEDIDGVSGATYTARAFTQSVQEAIRRVAAGELGLEVPPQDWRFVFGLPEVILILLLSVSIYRHRSRGNRKLKAALRWVTLLAGLVFVGFLFNGPFVLAHLNMVMLGYWPNWQTHIYWYILIFSLLFFKSQEEWNLYCYDFCPFGAAQDVIAKVSGAKPRPVRWPQLLLWLQRGLTIAAISLALMYRNPGMTSFEIFGTMFRLEGSNFQFGVLAIVFLTAFFIHRPWCRYLCPLHKNTTEGLFDRIRVLVGNLWQRLRPKRAV
jgi:NosR/NirI family nitrous oxide reductase transcriptional regulator